MRPSPPCRSTWPVRFRVPFADTVVVPARFVPRGSCRWGRADVAVLALLAAHGRRTPRGTRALPEGLERLQNSADHSWLRDLQAEPQQELHRPNREKRLVSSGHFVRVEPTPLLNTSLVAFSPSMAQVLGLQSSDCESQEFLHFMSGQVEVLPKMKSWCTPYTLSVAGNEISTGNMYGDGRAISVGEVLLHDDRWELQLKGAGCTPFCGGADGRAVLRSSLREFLASEAMYHLGVPSTWALCVVMSTSDTALREWVGETLFEPCAMTCRVARSFLRVGHLELFGRRARDFGSAEARLELEQLLRHVLAREYPECLDPQDDSLRPALMRMLRPMGERMAQLMAQWWRVGFCQGNFQSDNCHLGGRTLDFGPFGFLERYNPRYCSWSGGAEHFSFRLQPKAALQNLASAIRAMDCLLDSEGREEGQQVLRDFPALLAEAFAEVRMEKLGLCFWDSDAARLCDELLQLMEASAADWTLLWRRLADVAQDWDELMEGGRLLEPLQGSFYLPLSPELEAAWSRWLLRWLTRLQGEGDCEEVAQQMRRVNPKYVPRNWMLMEAYEAAEAGNFQVAQRLQQIFASPYEEHPEDEARYFRLAPVEMRTRPGVFVMS
ncbi:unnamed protein product [Durusdinium trenchii]|uniref:Selenoprotein O n=1 Tax=Durusdinium trenchii TaxID=1381693 RepID=A0ABP0S600_9DINO